MTLWAAVTAQCAWLAFSLRGADHAALFLIGLMIGAVLLRTEFGFTGSLRRFVVGRDPASLKAPLALIALTTLLFAPVLADSGALGRSAWPAAAPLGLQVAIGALLFGVGMQLGGGCGSGTLFSLGGGNGRMLVVIVFFCAGSFVGSLHMGWWAGHFQFDAIVLGESFGWLKAAGLQLAAIATLWWWIVRRQAHARSPAPRPGHDRWPMGFGVGALAVLNLATLLMAGHPWSITWAYTLWGAKGATFLGWDPASSAFWQAPFQASALTAPILHDVTSLMDVGIVLGAAGIALAAGRWSVRLDARPGALIAAVLGGLLMGYGARIAFGCTIGALVSGTASTSLHGWLWFAAVLPGVWVGARLRPRFGLASD